MYFDDVKLVGGDIGRISIPAYKGDELPGAIVASQGSIGFKSGQSGEVVLLPTTAGLFEFSSHTFTTAGSTGRYGPTLTQCVSSYTSEDASVWANDPLFFDVQNGSQIWTIPADGAYRIRAVGARGGRPAAYNHFGHGAMLEGVFLLSKGDKLRIVVGQAGADNGGIGTGSQGGGGAGGGASFAQIQGQTFPLILAGGGAGGGNYSDGGAPNIVDATAFTSTLR